MDALFHPVISSLFDFYALPTVYSDIKSCAILSLLLLSEAKGNLLSVMVVYFCFEIFFCGRDPEVEQNLW